MASNALELSIKIAGKIDNSFTSAISKAQKQTSSFAKSLSTIGKTGLAIEGALLTGTVTALKKCTDYAQEFQVQMADVAKYVNGLTDSNGKTTNAMAYNGKTYQQNYDNMKSQLYKLATQYALSPDELAVMAANLGQSGYSAEDIASVDENGNVTGVLRDTATMAAAFDIGTDQAGQWMAKWENAFGVGHEEILTLTDQINYLGNTSATTAAEIGEAVNRAGSLGSLSGVDTGTTAALATVMLQAGGDSSTVGTSLNRIFTNTMKGSSATDKQQAAWESLGLTAEGVASSMIQNGQATLVDIFSRISELAEDRRTATISTLFGQWAIADVSRVIANMPELQTALDKVNNPDMYTGSMIAEANVKNSTAKATGEMRESARLWLMDTIGTEFLPVESQFNQMMIGIYTGLVENMPQISELASSFADVLSNLVERLGTALNNALPYLQSALDWLAANPDTALKGLGAITGTFAAMAAAPKIEGAAKLLLGGSSEKSTGLLSILTGGAGKGQSTGILSTLFTGGQKAYGALKSSPSAVSGLIGDVKTIWGNSVLMSQMSGKSTLGGAMWNFAKAFMPSGLLQYGNSVSTAGSGVISAVAGAGGQGYKGIASIFGAAGNLFGTIGSPFMSLFSGVAPIIGIISTLIGLFTTMTNNIDSVRGAIGNVFGDTGLTIFDGFLGVIENISNFINGGWLNAFNNAKNFITQAFGQDIGNAFSALQPALESVFSFIQQIVTFGQTTVAPILEQIGGFITVTVGPQLLQLFTTLAPLLGTIGNLVGGAIMTGMTAVGNLLGAVIIPAIEAVITVVLNFANAVAPAVVSVIQGIAATVSTVVNAIINAINTVITGINSISIDIPEGVPLMGGKHIGFNLSPLPLLAKGGFTNGPSIAGEAGTEAVISFKSSERAANLATWKKAGQMLGAHGAEIRQLESGSVGRRNTNSDSVTFAPVFQFYGDVTREKAEEAGRISFAEFKRLYRQMKREEARTAF